jgi:Ca-activated chloride channel homolog
MKPYYRIFIIMAAVMTVTLLFNCGDSIKIRKGVKEDKKEIRKPYPAATTLNMEQRVRRAKRGAGLVGMVDDGSGGYRAPHDTEEYTRIYENDFKESIKNPLSTFSIDVDTASYANVRRFITGNRMPYKDAVRIEEMINYFNYDYPDPKGKHPFSFVTEISETPWNSKTKLLHIGLQGKKVSLKEIPPQNLVFLIDVSGSMSSPNKLPLLKKAFRLMVNQLRSRDRVAIVVYAGAAGLVLPSTPCSEKKRIIETFERFRAGGSTAGGAGIKLAYSVARENFTREGNNRVILATDGDFNIGASSSGELVRMIEEKRKSGIYLTVLGFGMGNYKDSRMEQLADKGNGNYAYIDNLLEAKKVLVKEIGGTLLTIARDVKIQIEFNPAKVKEYRLIGYENRIMAAKDFDNDRKDAGEMGAGHTVTALYEIVLNNEKQRKSDLKYSTTKIKDDALKSKEVATIKFRYKKPHGSKSILVVSPIEEKIVSLKDSTDNFRFSAAVAQWGMILRDSKFKKNSNYRQVISLAKNAKGEDREGYRSEFIRLVEITGALDNGK